MVTLSSWLKHHPLGLSAHTSTLGPTHGFWGDPLRLLQLVWQILPPGQELSQTPFVATHTEPRLPLLRHLSPCRFLKKGGESRNRENVLPPTPSPFRYIRPRELASPLPPPGLVQLDAPEHRPDGDRLKGSQQSEVPEPLGKASPAEEADESGSARVAWLKDSAGCGEGHNWRQGFQQSKQAEEGVARESCGGTALLRQERPGDPWLPWPLYKAPLCTDLKRRLRVAFLGRQFFVPLWGSGCWLPRVV